MTNIFACDPEPDIVFGEQFNLRWMDKEELLKNSDLVSLHIPYNQSNHHFINRKAISLMRTGSMIINTSRGAIIDENALHDALLQGHIDGAALDVFEDEPYEGPFTRFDNVILTAHMGASAKGSRYLMELGAAEDCVNALRGNNLKNDAIKDWQDLL
jgi:D-3-phosphoglycerate dehydrogenase